MSMSSTALVSTPSNSLYRPQAQSSSTLTRPQGSQAASPSTPAPQTANQSPVPTPSPGTFRHPRLTEIISRQNQTTFSESNVRSAVINGSALFLTIGFGSDIQSFLSTLLRLTPFSAQSTDAITSIIILLTRILFFLNTILSLRPILPYLSTKDNLPDIPLTPSQRALLGLPPSTTTSPATPSSFTTPPRYHHRLSSPSPSPSSPLSSSPDSPDRRSVSANYSSSPLSTSRHTLGFSPSSPSTPQTLTQPPPRRTASGSPFSPSNQSPLFHKAIDRDRRARRQSQDLALLGESGNSSSAFGWSRSSFGTSASASASASTSSLLGRSQSVKERGGFGRDGVGVAAAPMEGDRRDKITVQKGVNYKWLYDKGFGVRGGGGGGGAGVGLVRRESMGL